MTKALPDPLTLASEGIRLRLAAQGDLETLRAWKNANRQAFFDKSEITADGQRGWFRSYLERPDDHMYLVEEEADGAWITFGVLGCRRLGDEVDIYNVMRGPGAVAGKGKLGKALVSLCEASSIFYRLPVRCKVVLDNPARSFYEANGFVLGPSDQGYLSFTYSPRRASR